MIRKIIQRAGVLSVPILIGTFAFERSTRYEIFQRDGGVCQSNACIGCLCGGVNRSWEEGWHVQAAHFPQKHQKQEDSNPRNGRILCTHCHIVEEIQRDNFVGARLLWQRQTIRNHNWLNLTHLPDPKPPIGFFYDWAETDQLGRLGLARAYQERYMFEPVQQLNFSELLK